jgi:hypothetical protein
MTITCKKDESSDVSPSGPESEAEMAILRLNKFLQSSTATLSLALRSPQAAKPVSSAHQIMLK